MIDYRLKDYALRRRAFVRWCVWSITYNDCDPALFMTNYLFDRFEHNLEQKLWICWIFGTTYHFPATWVIWNEMPDFELVDQVRLERWNSENYRRLRYQTDTKYNKGFLPQQFASYREWIGGNSQRAKLESLGVTADRDPVQNFGVLYKEIVKNLYKFGRYSAWFYLQALKQCAGVPVDAPDLILSDYAGSRSHRNGLCYAVAKDEWVDQKLEPAQIAWLEAQAQEMMAEVRSLLPEELRHKADLFACESMLCSFKKLFRTHHGRYLGYYLDRQGEEIAQVEKDGWDGIYWQPLWDARTETIPTQYHAELLTSRIDKHRMCDLVEFGHIRRLEYIFNDEPVARSSSLESFF